MQAAGESVGSSEGGKGRGRGGTEEYWPEISLQGKGERAIFQSSFSFLIS